MNKVIAVAMLFVCTITGAHAGIEGRVIPAPTVSYHVKTVAKTPVTHTANHEGVMTRLGNSMCHFGTAIRVFQQSLINTFTFARVTFQPPAGPITFDIFIFKNNLPTLQTKTHQ